MHSVIKCLIMAMGFRFPPLLGPNETNLFYSSTPPDIRKIYFLTSSIFWGVPASGLSFFQQAVTLLEGWGKTIPFTSNYTHIGGSRHKDYCFFFLTTSASFRGSGQDYPFFHQAPPLLKDPGIRIIPFPTNSTTFRVPRHQDYPF